MFRRIEQNVCLWILRARDRKSCQSSPDQVAYAPARVLWRFLGSPQDKGHGGAVCRGVVLAFRFQAYLSRAWKYGAYGASFAASWLNVCCASTTVPDFQGRERNVAIAPQNGGRRQRQHMVTSWILLQYNLFIILSQSFRNPFRILQHPSFLTFCLSFFGFHLTLSFYCSRSAFCFFDLASMTQIHLPAQSLHGVRQEWDGVRSSRISQQLTTAHNNIMSE